MGDRRLMQGILLLVVLVWLALVGITMAAVFFDIGHVKPEHSDALFHVFLAELGLTFCALSGAIFMLIRKHGSISPLEENPVTTESTPQTPRSAAEEDDSSLKVASERPISESHDPPDFDNRIFEALTTVFKDRDLAVLLAESAGFPKSRLPPFSDPLIFWTNVICESRNGLLQGGIRPILEKAAEMYPDNPVFALRRTNGVYASSSQGTSLIPRSPKSATTEITRSTDIVLSLVRYMALFAFLGMLLVGVLPAVGDGARLAGPPLLGAGVLFSVYLVLGIPTRGIHGEQLLDFLVYLLRTTDPVDIILLVTIVALIAMILMEQREAKPPALVLVGFFLGRNVQFRRTQVVTEEK